MTRPSEFFVLEKYLGSVGKPDGVGVDLHQFRAQPARRSRSAVQESLPVVQERSPESDHMQFVPARRLDAVIAQLKYLSAVNPCE